MTIYIALLRGINVGGNNMVKMTELKLMFEKLGFNSVQTYINSGNVLFVSPESADQVRNRVEQEVRNVFGISVTVIIRTADELERIIANCPYPPESLLKGESVQVTLLAEEPSQDKVDFLSNGKSELDEFQMHGLEIYFLFRQSMLDSKLAKNMTKLGTLATSRNLNTMNKLNALANRMKP